MKIKLLLLVIFSGFFLSGCTSSSSNYSSPYYDNDYYEEYEDEPVTSDNWECTGDCSGHEAGYQWAEDHGITDSDDCGGNSDSFIEGCEAYTNEYQQEEYEESYDDYEDDYYY